jgi:hypothetical protein
MQEIDFLANMETLQGEVKWQCPTVSANCLTLDLIVVAFEMGDLYTIILGKVYR